MLCIHIIIIIINTFPWLLRGDLTAETESEIIAAQDQVLQTKYSVTKSLQTETANADYVNNLMTL
jgi:hypothetical protein